jgi:hypothetical protein
MYIPYAGVVLQKMFLTWESDPLEITIDTTSMPIQVAFFTTAF